jgi:hypothetical protein
VFDILTLVSHRSYQTAEKSGSVAHPRLESPRTIPKAEGACRHGPQIVKALSERTLLAAPGVSKS